MFACAYYIEQQKSLFVGYFKLKRFIELAGVGYKVNINNHIALKMATNTLSLQVVKSLLPYRVILSLIMILGISPYLQSLLIHTTELLR